MLVELILLDTHRPHPNHGTDWGNVSEQVAAGASVAALLAALVAVGVTLSIAKNADLKQIHDFLMSTEVQKGRRVMHRSFKKQIAWGDLEKADLDLVNNALSGYQRLAQYYEFWWVPRSRARKLWSGRIVSDWEQIESFIVWRRRKPGRQKSWDNLVSLARKFGANVTID